MAKSLHDSGELEGKKGGFRWKIFVYLKFLTFLFEVTWKCLSQKLRSFKPWTCCVHLAQKCVIAERVGLAVIFRYSVNLRKCPWEPWTFP